jgi:hypothetical protein
MAKMRTITVGNWPQFVVSLYQQQWRREGLHLLLTQPCKIHRGESDCLTDNTSGSDGE